MVISYTRVETHANLCGNPPINKNVKLVPNLEFEKLARGFSRQNIRKICQQDWQGC